MRLLLLGLAVALVAPGLAAGVAGPVTPPTDVGLLVLRGDPDGNMTLLLHVEDEPGGSYAYTRVFVPAQIPDVREVGAFVHLYARPDGTPIYAVGAYALSTTVAAVVRVPLVLVEGADSTTATTNLLLSLAAEALQEGTLTQPFLLEYLLPEFGASFAQPPDAAGFSTFHDFPTLYVWNVARFSSVGEAWAGSYLARTGSVQLDADGRVASAVKDAELGQAARTSGGTQRLAGAYVEDRYDVVREGDKLTHTDRITAGAAGAAGRVPLTVVELQDAREGSDATTHPRLQQTGASVGLVADGAYVPLLGTQTTQEYQPSQNGYDVTRVTSVGPYVEGSYMPVAGARYHSPNGELLAVLLQVVAHGPGAPLLAFETDVGPFVDGAYEPAAGLVVRSGFRDAMFAVQTFIGAGVYTPLGFVPLAVATYDGTRPMIDWAFAWLGGTAPGEAWRVAAGTTVAGTYVPVVGIEGVGRDPLGTRAQQQEFRLGTFAGNYRAFLPLVSVATDSDQTLLLFTTGTALGGGPGAPVGDVDAHVGTYLLGSYVPVAGAQVHDDWDGAAASEASIVVGAYGPLGFVPLLGIVYQSDVPVVTSLGTAGNLNDDHASTLHAGTFAPDGTFVPLVTVRNGPDAVEVTVGPDLTGL